MLIFILALSYSGPEAPNTPTNLLLQKYFKDHDKKKKKRKTNDKKLDILESKRKFHT